jgi:CheY-like chemotaxis protein
MDVLVIEDDRRIPDLIERGLHEKGHCVTVARNGRDGVDRLLDQAFDAALLCGVHYPSDIEASRRIAYALFGFMLATAKFQQDLAASSIEIRTTRQLIPHS